MNMANTKKTQYGFTTLILVYFFLPFVHNSYERNSGEDINRATYLISWVVKTPFQFITLYSVLQHVYPFHNFNIIPTMLIIASVFFALEYFFSNIIKIDERIHNKIIKLRIKANAIYFIRKNSKYGIFVELFSAISVVIWVFFFAVYGAFHILELKW